MLQLLVKFNQHISGTGQKHHCYYIIPTHMLGTYSCCLQCQVIKLDAHIYIVTLHLTKMFL